MKLKSLIQLIPIFLLGSAMLFTSCTKETLPEVKGATVNSEVQSQEQEELTQSSSPNRLPFFYWGSVGKYVIQSMERPELNLVLDVPNGSKGDGVIIQQYPYNGGENQKWELYYHGNGFYSIKNCASGKYLDVPNGSLAPGVKIQQYQINSGMNQDWTIQITGRPPIIPGTSDNAAFAMIRNRKSGLALTVPNNSTTQGTQIEQWFPVNQTWRLVRLAFNNDTYVPYPM